MRGKLSLYRFIEARRNLPFIIIICIVLPAVECMCVCASGNFHQNIIFA